VARALLGKIIVHRSREGTVSGMITETEGAPECVLIRALAPLEGVEIMKARGGRRIQRGTRAGEALRRHGDNGGASIGEDRIAVTLRIHIGYAGEAADRPCRFAIDGK
jgi:3-methyladenine DNA glycosylase Mpg